MGESSDSKDASNAPPWQSGTPKKTEKTDGLVEPAPESQETTLEQARRFLQQDEIRDAPTDKKITFLESKGLKTEDIHTLLGVTRNEEASSQSSISGPDSPPLSPPPPPSPPPAPPSPPQQSYVSSRQDSPPIITYPEFLTTGPHPTPLVTKPRLLTTLYIFGALASLLYGTSNYVVTPMVASLTISRLSLLATASENLSKLVAKLEGLVSEIPTTTSRSNPTGDALKDAEDESDSDPTEMFHRDVGVQTSLPSTPGSPATPSDSSHLDTQTNNLIGLKASIQALLDDNTSMGQEHQELEATVGVLKEYCDELAFVVPTPTYGFSGYAGSGRAEEKNDEIAKTKAAIRGVKGVLLSARSFPGGVRAGAR